MKRLATLQRRRGTLNMDMMIRKLLNNIIISNSIQKAVYILLMPSVGCLQRAELLISCVQ